MGPKKEWNGRVRRMRESRSWGTKSGTCGSSDQGINVKTLWESWGNNGRSYWPQGTATKLKWPPLPPARYPNQDPTDAPEVKQFVGTHRRARSLPFINLSLPVDLLHIKHCFGSNTLIRVLWILIASTPRQEWYRMVKRDALSIIQVINQYKNRCVPIPSSRDGIYCLLPTFSQSLDVLDILLDR